MLKIEVIKFEAQDIITNSGTAVAPCQHKYVSPTDREDTNGNPIVTCDNCGTELIFIKDEQPE